MLCVNLYVNGTSVQLSMCTWLRLDQSYLPARVIVALRASDAHNPSQSGSQDSCSGHRGQAGLFSLDAVVGGCKAWTDGSHPVRMSV